MTTWRVSHALGTEGFVAATIAVVTAGSCRFGTCCPGRRRKCWAPPASRPRYETCQTLIENSSTRGNKWLVRQVGLRRCSTKRSRSTKTASLRPRGVSTDGCSRPNRRAPRLSISWGLRSPSTAGPNEGFAKKTSQEDPARRRYFLHDLPTPIGTSNPTADPGHAGGAGCAAVVRRNRPDPMVYKRWAAGP